MGRRHAAETRQEVIELKVVTQANASIGGLSQAVELVDINLLKTGNSPRVNGQSAQHVQLLTEVVEEVPPILVYRQSFRVIDGMHRVLAAQARGLTRIAARYFDGSEADAFLLAVEQNISHGLPLNREERTAAAVRVIASHPDLSNRALASKVGLSDKTVALLRRRSAANTPHVNERVGRDGLVHPVNANEGRRKAAEFLRVRPHASIREVAAAGGIALATARDVRQRIAAGHDPVPTRARASQQKTTSEETPDRGHDVDGEVAAIGLAFSQLRNDPSLRFSETGRMILRLLDLHALDTGMWARTVRQVPPHCAKTVAEAADRCAEIWRTVAQSLRQRE